jgi:hypothetical protein
VWTLAPNSRFQFHGKKRLFWLFFVRMPVRK